MSDRLPRRPTHSSQSDVLYSLSVAQGGVEKKETLPQAAIRELLEEFGSDLDVWQTGKIPAAFHAYDLPKPTSEGLTHTKVCRKVSLHGNDPNILKLYFVYRSSTCLRG